MFFCGAHVSLKPDRTTTTPDFRLGARFPARRVVVNLRGQKGGGGCEVRVEVVKCEVRCELSMRGTGLAQALCCVLPSLTKRTGFVKHDKFKVKSQFRLSSRITHRRTEHWDRKISTRDRSSMKAKQAKQ